MEQVKWRVSGYFKADAQKVYEEIGEDAVTPEEVVKKAQKKNSELHKLFEWDDTVAAHKYRLEQARLVIRMLVVVPKAEEDTPIRAFSLTTESCTYQPTRFFLQQPDEYQALLERAKAELIAFKKKYKALTELEEIFEAIDEL